MRKGVNEIVLNFGKPKKEVETWIKLKVAWYKIPEIIIPRETITSF